MTRITKVPLRVAEAAPDYDRVITTPADAYTALLAIHPPGTFPQGCRFDPERECLMVLALNGRHAVVLSSVVSVGSTNHTIVCPRTIFRWLLRAPPRPAVAFILAHNHPSGSSEPSREDIEITTRVCQGGSLLGLKLLDHLVVTDKGYSSIREQREDLFSLASSSTYCGGAQ